MKYDLSYLRKTVRQLKNSVDSSWVGKDDCVYQDVARIELSSRILDMTEFTFFQLAYAEWYGRDLPERNMEPIFSDYMLRNEVPHWARHLARKVISRFYQGTLDPGEFNSKCSISPVRFSESPAPYHIVMTVIYIIFFLILSGQLRFN